MRGRNSVSAPIASLREGTLLLVRFDPGFEHRSCIEASEQTAYVRVPREFDRRAVGEHGTGLHRDHGIGEAHDLGQRVADVYDEQPQFVAQPLDIGEDLLAAGGVERRERFVHEQQARLREQRPADRDALLLATRKPQRTAIEQVADAEQVDHRVEADRLRIVARARFSP